MAIARNWEVLLARGIISAPKTEIIIPPIDPVYGEPKRFAWLKTATWTRAKVAVGKMK